MIAANSRESTTCSRRMVAATRPKAMTTGRGGSARGEFMRCDRNMTASVSRAAGPVPLDWREPMDEHARANPSRWDHQRHTLIRLRRQIDNEIYALRPGAGDWIVDMGCGDMPYRPLFEARGARYIGCDIDPAAQV